MMHSNMTFKCPCLLEYNYTHLFMYCIRLLCTIKRNVSSCQINHKAYKG